VTRGELHGFVKCAFEYQVLPLLMAGQKEYAHQNDNAFDNFERIAKEAGISREAVLWILALKHKDGISAWIKGHRSQREGVGGRIEDFIVYLFILLAMICPDLEGGIDGLPPGGKSHAGEVLEYSNSKLPPLCSSK